MRVFTSDSSGFTIVELVVGMVLIGIFAVTVSLMQTNTAELAERGRDVSSLNSFAEDKIEALRSKGYLGISTGTQDISSELPSDLNSPKSATLTITSVPDAIKQAQLSITYNEQGTDRTYSYTTYIGEVGVGQY
ncbi:MAG TPA: prepilin-type N-terminal cleavage/methylation domain-containing protein [Candidatus Saccharimonadales bacterium]|nr:prepilin-type N-terminal cleavage/methylation domain-containing protein [Candidatus Saccharimonadales bacterium]